MSGLINYTNQRIGMVVVLKQVERDPKGRISWLIKCDCGKEKITNSTCLSAAKRRSYLSCGCLVSKNGTKQGKKSRTHGLSRNPLYKAFHGAKTRAKTLKIPFDITLDYLQSIETKICPILGIPLHRHTGTTNGWSLNDSPTIDRLIPSKGYTEGNVAIISMRANLLKKDASLSEIKAIANWMEKQYYERK